MSKKVTTLAEGLGNAPEEITKTVTESARQAKDTVLSQPRSAVPRVVLMGVVLLGLGLVVVALRRRS